MAKTKYRFVCQSCGYVTAKWLGRCPECGAWDTFAEEAEVSAKPSKSYLLVGSEKVKPRTIASVAQVKVERLATGIREFDRVLGGGIVPGSLVLLGGTPGIGKSTILLDAGLRFGQRGVKVLYVSGEESEEQTAMRAVRLGGANAGSNLLIMTATDLDAILTQANAVQPQLLIIDSIQTMYNPELQTAAGSVGQVRECTAKLLQFAKTTGIAVLVIGHVTKDGNIAGPRLLEHMVDVVLQFEGDRSYAFRVLRALKNRFGSTEESGIFSMEAGGLAEVANPAGLFLEDRDGEAAGSMIGACMEGNRPIMVEFQALVAKTPYGMPRRTAVGFDYNRVNMLLAILERRLGLDFGMYDAYVNVVGGMRITEPAADLAVAAALVSSYRNRAIPKGVICFGEVGLTGEVRRVSAPERRILDGLNLGFHKFIIPDSSLKIPDTRAQIIKVKTLEQALQALFER
ncbi:MAG: DNA repair protein RadA [Phascolarctobacterium sp.]|uniref:DNA repair protein RadA n=1 Tax=Phascolarctobacterium sp. TaxID=2049039 RepID=UPI0026DCCC36|nr:DNA repair protein RadA [Phascolarctobacterium sp.]MDO4921947.1 DNA repair protein RadA [Phascolarctobacterium sp.]